jgi:protein-disulfide isomerase
MASRKDQKEEARAQREAFERNQTLGAQRRRRLQLLGAAIVLAIVLVGAAVALSSGGGGTSKGIAGGKKASRTVAAVSTLLKGIPQSGTVLGNRGAPVTIQYFADLECPICRDFTMQALPQIVKDDVRTGKVKIDFLSLQTATDDPATFTTQQVAALAAGRQNRLWHYVELFYHEQGQEGTGYVTDAYLRGLAQQVPGLNLAKWQSARSDAALTDVVRSDATAANVVGASGTPTIVIKGPKGSKTLPGVPSAAAVEQAVSAASASV